MVSSDLHTGNRGVVNNILLNLYQTIFDFDLVTGSFRSSLNHEGILLSLIVYLVAHLALGRRLMIARGGCKSSCTMISLVSFLCATTFNNSVFCPFTLILFRRCCFSSPCFFCRKCHVIFFWTETEVAYARKWRSVTHMLVDISVFSPFKFSGQYLRHSHRNIHMYYSFPDCIKKGKKTNKHFAFFLTRRAVDVFVVKNLVFLPDLWWWWWLTSVYFTATLMIVYMIWWLCTWFDDDTFPDLNFTATAKRSRARRRMPRMLKVGGR